MRVAQIFLWVVGIFITTTLKAGTEPLLVDQANKYFDPAGYVSYFSDPSNSIPFEQILETGMNQKFISLDQPSVNFGFSDITYWLRFRVQNRSSFHPYLEIRNAALDSVEYFLVSNDGVLLHRELTGNDVKIAHRSLRSSKLILNMQLPDAGIYTCYLKISSKSSAVSVPMRIASLEQFFESHSTENTLQGIYFGLIVFLFIYNLFLFASIKDTSYLYFALFIGTSGFLFSLYSGFTNEVMWYLWPKNQHFISLFAALSVTFLILFSNRFLYSRARRQFLQYWFLALMLINIPLVILDLFGFHSLAIKLILYNSIVALIFQMYLAVKSWNDGFKPARYYLMAWSFHVLGTMVSLILDAFSLNIGINIYEILQITSTISIFLMSFALSKKINLYIESRDRARDLALRTALENEQLISNQNQMLEQRVVQRTIDLEQTIDTLSKQRKDLQDANRFKDKIFSIISHDLKSPITSLAGLLQIMRLKTLNEEERSRAISSLEIALKGTKNLLDNILAWASKHPGTVEENQEIELHNLVNELFEIFHYQALSKNISLINLMEKNFHIISNQNMLQLVLRNLISNALKFTPKNGAIEVGMRQDFPNLEIFVKDTGIGMTKEMIAKLFRSDEHNSTRGTENEKGTGLGLKLCKEFLDKYDGSIHVESEPRQGSTFTITLKKAIPVLEVVVH